MTASAETHAAARAQLVELARAPERRSKLLDPRDTAELRAAVDALLERVQSWRPPPRASDDGPPAPDELLLIVPRSKRTANTRRLYARELALFFAFCAGRDQAAYAVRAEHVEDYLALLATRGLAEASRAVALAAISE